MSNYALTSTSIPRQDNNAHLPGEVRSENYHEWLEMHGCDQVAHPTTRHAKTGIGPFFTQPRRIQAKGINKGQEIPPGKPLRDRVFVLRAGKSRTPGASLRKLGNRTS